MDQGTGRYAAFLSYSHKDAADARWLHRRLETYRIPRRLVGTEGERGTVPARLTPIFRDREELPAAGDLSERVRAALAASDNLVILCSPNAAASPWVAKEITAFRELHPDRPTFAAIVDADPPHCFPPNLAAGGAEPLAADLRRGRDGRRLGLLKLVAGLSGVGLDALVQRDAQRRIRRVTAVTGAALAAMLVMVVLTGIALTQRREAQRQRAEAEGLVEFMLTDLRDGLKGVGSLDVLTAVNQRALRYYGSRRDLRSLPDDSLARRARILQAIGDDDLTRCLSNSAFSAYQEAMRVTEEQLARHPDDPERVLDHAKSDYRIGRIYELRHDWEIANKHYLAFAEAANRLAASGQGNVTYLGEAAAANMDLGAVRFGRGDYEAAGGFYDKARQLLDRAARLKPGYSHTLFSQAKAYRRLAEAALARGLTQAALNWRRKQYEIASAMFSRQPDNFEVRYALALAERGLGSAFLAMGDRTNAREHLFKGFQIAAALTGQDPKNRDWRMARSSLSRDIVQAGIGLPPGITAQELTAEAAFADSPSCTLNLEINHKAAV